MTAAYKKAISDAINENNGVINKAIADAVQDALDKVNAKLAAIDNQIAAIQKDIEGIKNSITSINQQIAAINGSIADLKTVDAELKSYINALQNTANDLQSKIDAANAALAALESDLKGQITASEQKVLNELASVKSALEGQLATINNTIAALKAKDEELDQKIANLQTYVDNELANYATTDWATATFATLQMYQETQEAIAGIELNIKNINDELKALETRINQKIATDIKAAVDALRSELEEDYTAKILSAVEDVTSDYKAAIQTARNEIEAAYKAAIETAVATLKTEMQNWVNKQLEKPLEEIAALQAALNALTNEVATDEELAAAVAAQEKALKKAVDDLTAAYKKAIEDAINGGNGTISGEIADAIKAAQDKLQAIDTAITDINNRLGTLEKNFANRIQSLTYIPTHTDGKATMAYDGASGKWEAELSFFVTPKSVVGNIMREHISVKGVYTTATRAVNIIECDVTAFDRDATNGTITVTVSGDNLTNFLSGTSDAAVFLIISDGNSEFVSDYVPLALKDPGNIDAADMSADELKTTVSQALNDGERDFIIAGNLNEDQQKAVGAALRDWCGAENGFSYNEAGRGTVSLTLPDVTEIFANTFGEIILDADKVIIQVSHALKSVNLPNVTEVGNYAFEGCVALSHVDMPNVEKVGVRCFESSSLTDFTFTNLKEIGERAFRNTDLVTVDLAQVTYLGGNAFSFCNNLQSVTAPLLTEVLQWAFADCEKLTSLTFGKPITKWESQVLNNMTTENITLTLHPNQKVLTGGSNAENGQSWTVANDAATVEFGTGKAFCGYTFKEIKKYGE